MGFAEPTGSPRPLVRSYRTVSPSPVPRLPKGAEAIGGLFSVALSCGSPRLAASQHPSLWSPDLPQRNPLGGDAAVTRPAHRPLQCGGSGDLEQRELDHHVSVANRSPAKLGLATYVCPD